MLNKKQKELLLSLARETLREYFVRPLTQDYYQEVEQRIKDVALKEQRATFVSLINLDGSLRGCIGHLEPYQALWRDVIENTLAAAFNDPRFFPLQQEELEKIRIEVSILSPLKRLSYRNSQELLEKLRPRQDGVLLKKEASRATFLPQVWDKVQDKVEFLSLLCQKAGLEPVAWRQGDLEVFVYGVEKIGEEEA